VTDAEMVARARRGLWAGWYGLLAGYALAAVLLVVWAP